MTTASSERAAAAPPAPEPLRVVLFGLPAAGKTSLLGALAQAAQTQARSLHGRLVDPSGDLAELRDRLYEDRGGPTAEEVVPHPVRFEPSDQEGGPKATPQPIDAVLLDCDGRVANDILARRQALDGRGGRLAREVVAADALLLTVDAAAPPAQVQADFAEFGRFLHLLERYRGGRAEVGGLPVFLVLTKCDLLAAPGDATPDWVERVEERKRELSVAFQDFLGRQGGAAFGSIDPHVWATAVKYPPLAGAPARPRQPFGVAELFRQALDRADRFRRRRRASARRLAWTVGGALAVVAGLVALAAALVVVQVLNRPHPLQSRLPPREEDAAVRLRGPVGRLLRLQRGLDELRADPRFGSLPPADREYVNELAREVSAYLAYGAALEEVPAVGAAETDKELEALEKRLLSVTVPAPYRGEWGGTEAVRERDARLADVRALRAALEDEADEAGPLGWYWALRREGRELEAAAPAKEVPAEWAAWGRRVRDLLAKAEKPTWRPAGPLPGAATLTYGDLLRFRKVAEVRGDWLDRVRPRLEALRDLAAALGLVPAGGPGGAPLDVPDLGKPTLAEARRFVQADAARRARELERLYPQYAERFVPSGQAPALPQGFRDAAQERYDRLVRIARPIILERLRQTDKDKKEWERWQAVVPWLKGPPELGDWRVLARLLAHLHDPGAQGPLDQLAAFLQKESFTLDFRRVTLEIPYGLGIEPTGKPLEVFYPAATKSDPAVVLELEGEPERVDARRVRLYHFKEPAVKALTYRPGAENTALLARLPVEKGNREMYLTWAQGRSAAYQFEQLLREPLLHVQGRDYTKEDAAPGVRLRFEPEGAIPHVPGLLPVVDLSSRDE